MTRGQKFIFWLILSICLFTIGAAFWEHNTKPRFIAEHQTWITNASFAKVIPQPSAIQSESYIRNLINKGAKAQIVVVHEGEALDLAVSAKDVGQYWATVEIHIYRDSRLHEVKNISTTNGTMRIELKRNKFFPIFFFIISMIVSFVIAASIPLKK